MKRFYLSMIFFIIIAMPLTLAEIEVSSPNPSIILLDAQNKEKTIEFLNTNSSNPETLELSLSSSLTDAVTISKDSMVVTTTNTIKASLKDTNLNGTYTGFLTYQYGVESGNIPITAIIENEEIDYDIIVFPTSKIINVKQGTEKSQNILVSVPATYPEIVTIQSVDFSPGTDGVRFGDLNLGQISPGDSLAIPITFDATEAQTGTYNTGLNIFATDSNGKIDLPSVSLTMYVTTGVSPATEETFNTPPTCTLSSTTLNLNQTYSFTCSPLNNLEVIVPYSDYYIGQNVDVSTTTSKYEFKPVKFGNTKFIAHFYYKGYPVFEAFESEIRISSSGSELAGTDLKFLFTPSLEYVTGDDEVIIQLVDNKTGSLVKEPRIWINAIEQTNEGDTFKFKFEPNKNYELRGKTEGYNDLIKTIKIEPKELEVLINPTSGDTSTYFNITTNKNATIKINGIEKANPFLGYLSAGINEIEVNLNGYLTKKQNITINDIMRIHFDNGIAFDKGVEQNLTLNKDANYKVFYQKTREDTDRENIYEGYGRDIIFKPSKKGVYTIEADGYVVGSYVIEGFSFSETKFLFPNWFWIVLVGLVLIAGYFIYNKNKNKYSGGSSGVQGIVGLPGGD